MSKSTEISTLSKSEEMNSMAKEMAPMATRWVTCGYCGWSGLGGTSPTLNNSEREREREQERELLGV